MKFVLSQKFVLSPFLRAARKVVSLMLCSQVPLLGVAYSAPQPLFCRNTKILLADAPRVHRVAHTLIYGTHGDHNAKRCIFCLFCI